MEARVSVIDPGDGNANQVYFRQLDADSAPWRVDREDVQFHICVTDPGMRALFQPGQVWTMRLDKRLDKE